MRLRVSTLPTQKSATEVCGTSRVFQKWRAYGWTTSTSATTACVTFRLLVNLQELVLDARNVTDRGLESLQGMQKLWHSDIERAAITNAGLARLQSLKSLERLDLHDTKASRWDRQYRGNSVHQRRQHSPSIPQRGLRTGNEVVQEDGAAGERRIRGLLIDASANVPYVFGNSSPRRRRLAPPGTDDQIGLCADEPRLGTLGGRFRVAGWSQRVFCNHGADGTRGFGSVGRQEPLSGGSRECGAASARGEFVTYLDPGDAYYPDYLAGVVAAGQESDVLLSGFDIAHENDSLTPNRPHGNPDRSSTGFLPRTSSLPWVWLIAGRFWNGSAASTSCFVRRGLGLLETVGHERGCVFAAFQARAEATAAAADRANRSNVLPTPLQLQNLAANLCAGRPLFYAPAPITYARKIETIAFASPHCPLDFTNYAAIATCDALHLLARPGIQVRGVLRHAVGRVARVPDSKTP